MIFESFQIMNLVLSHHPSKSELSNTQQCLAGLGNFISERGGRSGPARSSESATEVFYSDKIPKIHKLGF